MKATIQESRAKGMKQKLRGFLDRYCPRLTFVARAWRALYSGEPELKILGYLVDANRTSVDVGANIGTYTYWLSRYSSKVVSFEPNPGVCRYLKSVVPGNVTVYDCALGREGGSGYLEVPTVGGRKLDTRGRVLSASSADTADTVEGEAKIEVRSLDDMDLRGVGFVKIDVEGHEVDVLAGGVETIVRERPVVLVEAEERHHSGAVEEVFAYFSKYDYSGYFVLDGSLVSSEHFDLNTHQAAPPESGARTGSYVNNFVFVPTESRELFLKSVSAKMSVEVC